MIRRLRFAVLLGMLLAAACAPAQASAPFSVTPTALPDSTETIAAPPTASPNMPTLTPEPSPVPVATSRGPNLEATNPGSVALASGGLQLVEFFRFT